MRQAYDYWQDQPGSRLLDRARSSAWRAVPLSALSDRTPDNRPEGRRLAGPHEGATLTSLGLDRLVAADDSRSYSRRIPSSNASNATGRLTQGRAPVSRRALRAYVRPVNPCNPSGLSLPREEESRRRVARWMCRQGCRTGIDSGSTSSGRPTKAGGPRVAIEATLRLISTVQAVSVG